MSARTRASTYQLITKFFSVAGRLSLWLKGNPPQLIGSVGALLCIFLAAS